MTIRLKYNDNMRIEKENDFLIFLVSFFLILSGTTMYHYLNPPIISVGTTKWILYILCLLLQILV